MNNIQETLLFPVRDAEARKQFLIACAVALAMFIVPILPMLLLWGYSAKIMRQIVEEKKAPSMPAWRSDDLSDTLMDGLHLYGAQFVLMLPLLIMMGFGMVFLFAGSTGMGIFADRHASSWAPIAMFAFMIGIFIFMLFSVLSLPYGLIVSAALPHVALKRSFQAAFEFKEWFAIFRKAIGQFILGYAIVMAASFVIVFVMQIAAMTLVLLCIVPLLMVPYMAYQILIMNAFFAQAYLTGQQGLQAA